MSIYYPGCETDIVADYIANCCPDKEGAGLRHCWVQKNTFSFVDPEDPTEWETAIAAGDILIIPNVRGTYDGGNATKSEGFGDVLEEFESYEGTAQFTDRNYLNNTLGYEALMKSSIYKFGFCTQTKGFLTDVAAGFVPKMEVVQDKKQNVYGLTEVKFVQTGLLHPFTYPRTIFQCFQVIN